MYIRGAAVRSRGRRVGADGVMESRLLCVHLHEVHGGDETVKKSLLVEHQHTMNALPERLKSWDYEVRFAD